MPTGAIPVVLVLEDSQPPILAWTPSMPSFGSKLQVNPMAAPKLFQMEANALDSIPHAHPWIPSVHRATSQELQKLENGSTIRSRCLLRTLTSMDLAASTLLSTRASMVSAKLPSCSSSDQTKPIKFTKHLTNHF